MSTVDPRPAFHHQFPIKSEVVHSQILETFFKKNCRFVLQDAGQTIHNKQQNGVGSRKTNHYKNCSNGVGTDTLVASSIHNKQNLCDTLMRGVYLSLYRLIINKLQNCFTFSISPHRHTCKSSLYLSFYRVILKHFRVLLSTNSFTHS